MELISREEAIKTIVALIEQIERTEEIQVVDRPCGWESIEAYAREIIGELPSQWVEINEPPFGRVYQNAFVTFLSTETYDYVKRRLHRPKGEWIEEYPHTDGTGGYRCFNCGEYFCFVSAMNKNFCPNCGADMRGEE